MIEIKINEHELKSQVLDEIVSGINTASALEEQQTGEKHYEIKLSEKAKNFIINEWGCDYDSLNGVVNEMIGAINEHPEVDGKIGANKKDKKPFDFNSDKIIAYQIRDYEAYRTRMAQQKKSIKREHISCKDDDIRDWLLEEISECDVYDLDIIMSACRELGFTLGYRYADDEIIAVETLDGSFCGHLYKNPPIYESGKYKIDDYKERIEILCEAMLEMNDYYYDVQINCRYTSDETAGDEV